MTRALLAGDGDLLRTGPEPAGGRMPVGELAQDVPVIPVCTPALEVDRMLRADPELRGVVVREGSQLRLLTRARADDLLAGPYGYGRALLGRRDLRALLPESTLVVPAETPLPLMARHMLRRPASARHDDAVVTWADSRIGLVLASEVFEYMSDLYQQVSLHDPLTGLPNRLVIEHHAGRLLGASVGGEVTGALLYVDLDRFKDVNDTLGHRAGDQVLVMFAERLRSAVRPGDLLARLGGDEFVVLLADVSEGAAEAIAERIILSAAAPFAVQGTPVFIGASVGIAMVADVTGEQRLSGLEALLRQADDAMYRAKSSGRGRAHRSARGGTEGVPSRAALVRRLRTAIQDEALTVHYQPRLSLPAGTVVEVEALLRWTDSELGVVGPDCFIPVAEGSGLIVPIGAWVLAVACRQAQAWRAAGQEITVGVNLSPVQLRTPGLATEVTRILAETGLPARLLKLEVTETAAIEDVRATVGVLEELRALGIRIALDDFGTGYSSLAMLAELPLHEVKIDRTFIQRLNGSSGDAALVGLIVQAAHILGLTVIAEGVETPAQLEAVTRLGCDAAQGFLLGRPAPASMLPVSAGRALQA